MRIRWTPAAAADLQGIGDYLSEHHPHFRQQTLRQLYEGVRSLKDSPYRGKPGREAGSRELLFTPMPYVVVYRAREQVIAVLRVFHTAQNRP